jgi:hypothetical protein
MLPQSEFDWQGTHEFLLQTDADANVQSAVLAHWTQAFVEASHTGLSAEQPLLAVHCTQLPGATPASLELSPASSGSSVLQMLLPVMWEH